MVGRVSREVHLEITPTVSEPSITFFEPRNVYLRFNHSGGSLSF